jgi:diphosphomevalonate decarboxylase
MMDTFEKELLDQAAGFTRHLPQKESGNVSWESPSNIAIVKYWGKYPGQIPANASVSITLSKALSRTAVAYRFTGKEIKHGGLNFTFEGKQVPAFTKRVKKYLDTITRFLPWLTQTELTIQSENTFPHSSGIASSALAMSALALGLCEIDEQLYDRKLTEHFFRKASFLARLGSGSASRSLYGKMAVWGSTSGFKDTSDEYAVPLDDIHENMLGMRDSILIIESGTKQVSSSLGHDLMKTNPYARLRFDVAEENMQKLASVIRNGETAGFIDIVENEALSLHAMMMTSNPGFILMKPNTIEAIHRIRNYRKETGLLVGFTLDAGANVHVLYPEDQAVKAAEFIDTALKPLCENGQIIHDRMGEGPSNTGLLNA